MALLDLITCRRHRRVTSARPASERYAHWEQQERLTGVFNSGLGASRVSFCLHHSRMRFRARTINPTSTADLLQQILLKDN